MASTAASAGSAASGSTIPRKHLDLDDILVQEVGQLGWYQVRSLLLISFFVIFGGFTLEYVFTAARIPTRCLIPECDGEQPEFSPPWLGAAVPSAGEDSYENCERFAPAGNVTAVPPAQLNDTCPERLFDTTTTVACEQYVYENTKTVVHEFGLACDEWRRARIGTLRTFGNLFVLPITGFISDRWGRRVALVFNAVNTAWVGITRSFVNTYEWFLALEILESALGSGGFSCCHILVTELVGPKYRVAAGAIILSFFSVGQILLAVIAWAVDSWRTMTRIIYIPQLIFVSYLWIVSESVRWLMSKSRYAESEKILLKLSEVNKRPLSKQSLECLRETVEAYKFAEKPKEPWLPLLVFKSRPVLFRCCITPIWWITNTFIYYGMSLNAVNLAGNRYINFILVSAVEIPGFWSGILLLDRVGRKPVLICAYWICSACQFAFAFLPEHLEGGALSMTIYLIGKFCIALIVTSVYVYTSELYPTKYRHRLFAFSSTIGRIGSITAELTPALALEVWTSLPSVLFGSFALLSGLLIFTMPETLGCKLPDTIEEAEQIGRKRGN